MSRRYVPCTGEGNRSTHTRFEAVERFVGSSIRNESEELLVGRDSNVLPVSRRCRMTTSNGFYFRPFFLEPLAWRVLAFVFGGSELKL
jgi:hypothetical protein